MSNLFVLNLCGTSLLLANKLELNFSSSPLLTGLPSFELARRVNYGPYSRSILLSMNNNTWYVFSDEVVGDEEPS